jgi:hypothetical protein
MRIGAVPPSGQVDPVGHQRPGLALVVLRSPGHVMVGWPKGRHGPLRRRLLTEFVSLDHWGRPADDLVASV